MGLVGGLENKLLSATTSDFSSSELSVISLSSGGRILPYSIYSSLSISISSEKSCRLSSLILLMGSGFFGIKVYEPTEIVPGCLIPGDSSLGTILNITVFGFPELSSFAVNFDLISANFAKFESF